MKKIFLQLIGILLVGTFVNEGVLISDVSGSDTGNEWVEIYNDGVDVSLDGWYIEDKDSNKFYFPDVVISGFYVLSGLTAFTNSGDNVSLYDDGDNLIDNSGWLVDQGNDENTWQRVPNGFGDFIFKTSTQGFSNDNSSSVVVFNQSLIGYLVGNATTLQNESYPTCAFNEENLSISSKVFWGDCVGDRVWVQVGLGGGEFYNFTAMILIKLFLLRIF
jgi:hypothetical protein